MIGINTAIYGSGNMGIGFAMPINRAKAMIEDYKAGKSFKTSADWPCRRVRGRRHR